MPNISSNDDDIFEDYVEERPSNVEDIVSSTNPVDKVFSDVESPFKSLLNQTSLKVNFGEAFYTAAHQWIMTGYRHANMSAIIEELNVITNGSFLYRNRLSFCRESIARIKVIVRFLNIILNDDEVDTIIKQASTNMNIQFTQTYFNMFFRSFYNIQLHCFYKEVSLYRVLCEITDTPVDEQLIDLSDEDEKITDMTDFINNLYDNTFDHQSMQERVDRYFNEYMAQKES